MGKKPGAKVMAVALSVVAAVCIAAFLPLLYLFVDLLVWKGKVPSFVDLSPGQQAAFREANPFHKLWGLYGPNGVLTNPDQRQWWDATPPAIEARIGSAAAEAYRSAEHDSLLSDDKAVGILCVFAREQGRW